MYPGWCPGSVYTLVYPCPTTQPGVHPGYRTAGHQHSMYAGRGAGLRNNALSKPCPFLRRLSWCSGLPCPVLSPFLEGSPRVRKRRKEAESGNNWIAGGTTGL